MYSNGRTTYENITHHKRKNPMVSFGEVVMFKLATDKAKRHKLDTEWDRGILIGISGRSTEMIVANQDGVYKCRTIRRVPKENMADPNCLSKIKIRVASYIKSGAKTSVHKPRVVEPMPEAPNVREMETRWKEIVPRRVNLRKQDFLKFGYAAGCPECQHQSTGQGHRKAHSEECRKRMERAFKSSREGQKTPL